MRTIQVIILVPILIASSFCYARTYPKNLDIDILNYSFHFTLSDSTDEIVGRTNILIAIKKADQEKFRLDLINISKQLDGKGMIVDRITMGDQVLKFNHENNELYIYYAESPAAGSIIEVSIAYHGVPADGLRIGKNKHGDRGFFSGNWPIKARHWLPVIDHPYEKATSEFLVTAPAQYDVISNGLKKEESILPSGLKRTHWKQSVPISSWLYVLGVAEFAIQYLDTFEGKSIESWVYKQDREIGFKKLANPTKHSLAFFSDYVGPFAYEKLANVMSPSIGGAMETASAVFYNENSIEDDKSTWLMYAIAHENAHHWFGNSVTEYNWDDAWLSEGFATYFTLLFREHAYGRDNFNEGLIDARNKMVEFYRKTPDYQIVDDNMGIHGMPTSLATYEKGAWVLHMLRRKMGDANFKSGIQSYYRRFMNSTAVTKDFINEMELASGQDLDAFFKQWLYQGGIPVLLCEWYYDRASKELQITISQTQKVEYDYQVPVNLDVYSDSSDRPKRITIPLSKRKETISLAYEAQPAELVFDPEIELLAEWKIINKETRSAED